MTLTIKGKMHPGFEQILTTEACDFLEKLHNKFEPTRRQLMDDRKVRQDAIDAGGSLSFDDETTHIREGDWKVATPPSDLQDRRVEITGPCDRKMVINALNTDAKVFMACLEDATSPHWFNVIDGQINLRDAAHGQMTHTDPKSGKSYELKPDHAVLRARPRGWHLLEKHVLVDGDPISGALLDFGLYFFHNAQKLLDRGTGPYFYLPKLEHYAEARLWKDVFVFVQDTLGIPQGSIRATVLIETLPGAFHADEILYELRDHIDALNCGRWDYIFSYIKVFRKDPTKVLPDRSAVTMAVPFMDAYSRYVISVCHKRGAHAMGGMAAQIPVKGDEDANKAAFEKVRIDKEREVKNGHDGTWVAHPGLVPIAMDVFNQHMPNANQVEKQLDEKITAEDLTTPCDGPKTMDGLRMNVNVGVGYVAAWLNGLGAVPLHNLMEDAATAEISRTQLWQWRKCGVTLDGGEKVDDALIKQVFADEMKNLQQLHGDEGVKNGKYREAIDLMEGMILADELDDFLTLPAYDRYLAPSS